MVKMELLYIIIIIGRYKNKVLKLFNDGSYRDIEKYQKLKSAILKWRWRLSTIQEVKVERRGHIRGQSGEKKINL